MRCCGCASACKVYTTNFRNREEPIGEGNGSFGLPWHFWQCCCLSPPAARWCGCCGIGCCRRCSAGARSPSGKRLGFSLCAGSFSAALGVMASRVTGQPAHGGSAGGRMSPEERERFRQGHARRLRFQPFRPRKPGAMTEPAPPRNHAGFLRHTGQGGESANGPSRPAPFGIGTPESKRDSYRNALRSAGIEPVENVSEPQSGECTHAGRRERHYRP